MNKWRWIKNKRTTSQRYCKSLSPVVKRQRVSSVWTKRNVPVFEHHATRVRSQKQFCHCQYMWYKTSKFRFRVHLRMLVGCMYPWLWFRRWELSLAPTGLVIELCPDQSQLFPSLRCLPWSYTEKVFTVCRSLDFQYVSDVIMHHFVKCEKNVTFQTPTLWFHLHLVRQFAALLAAVLPSPIEES